MFVRLTILALLCLSYLTAQSQRNCGSHDHYLEQLQQDPQRQSIMESIEKHTQKFATQASNRSAAVLTIPVVVHVIYNTAAQNISEAQINSQMVVLNEDFRRLNADADNVWSQAADSELEFCLASIDPNGNPTNGITRTSTNVTSFGTNDNMKFTNSGGQDAWPASDYMNIWVCAIGGGILGYAQFPGGPANTDGIACDYRYFGTIGTATAPFDLGRTMTHEVGHYLNLRHIWGDGNCNQDDFVADTPSSDAANYGCALGHVSCSSVDMVQNYMDYSDDACMNLYTQGQKTRMQALFAPGGARYNLGLAAACGQTPPPPPPTGCDDNEIVLNLVFDNYSSETSWNITDDSGSTVATGSGYSQSNGSALNIDLCLANGCYTFTINDSYGDGICCSYGNGSYTLADGITILASGGTFSFTEATSFCLGSTPPPPTPTCDDNMMNGDETGVDCGGADCPPCNTGGCTYVTIDFENFNNGWGIWNDGGSDARRSSQDAAFANSGVHCIRLRDNTSSSVMTTDNIDLSSYEEISIDFTYITSSMDNANEDFWLQISTNGGASYTTVEEWNLNDEFVNNQREFDAVLIEGPFTSSTRFRFRCDASANDDLVYIDDIEITGCTTQNRESLNALPLISTSSEIQLDRLYPNPADDMVNLDIASQIDQSLQLTISDLTGKKISSTVYPVTAGNNLIQIATQRLSNNIYFITVSGDVNTVTKKFVVLR